MSTVDSIKFFDQIPLPIEPSFELDQEVDVQGAALAPKRFGVPWGCDADALGGYGASTSARQVL